MNICTTVAAEPDHLNDAGSQRTSSGISRVPIRKSLFRLFWGPLLCVAGGCHESAEIALESTPARIAARGEEVPSQVQFREHPIQIVPVQALEDCVTDDQIAVALEASLPWWSPPPVPSLVHELQLWGPDCEFSKKEFGERWTGQMMIETLLSNSLCRERTVRLDDFEDRAYLIKCPYGIHPTQAGTYDAVEFRAETHYGKLAKLMAEANQPLSVEVTASSGEKGTFEDILHDTVMRFSWGMELEFVACGLAYWLPPDRSWTNQFHDTFTFDELVLRLLAKPLSEGTCGGTHTPYAVVVILRVNEQCTILSDEVRERAEDWLRELHVLLRENQREDGGWDLDWATNSRGGAIYGDFWLDRITVAGHHLEWMALLPAGFEVDRQMVRRAVQYTTTAIGKLPTVQARGFKSTLPCSHAARAMTFLKGRDAFSSWRQLREARESRETD